MERKNIYIVILSITTIIAACFAVYFAVNPIAKNNEEVEFTGNIVESNKEEIVTNNESTNVKEETVSTNESANVKIEEKIVYEYKRPTIDATKCINPVEGTEYNICRDTGDITHVCSASTTGKKEVSLTINWDLAEKQYSITKPSSVNDIMATETKTISNFNTNVIDVYISYIGQDVTAVLLFLMEDGTVEYMPLYETLKAKEYKSYGKVTGVENVVEVIKGSNNRTGVAPIALKQDGSFYDLAKIIKGM